MSQGLAAQTDMLSDLKLVPKFDVLPIHLGADLQSNKVRHVYDGPGMVSMSCGSGLLVRLCGHCMHMDLFSCFDCVCVFLLFPPRCFSFGIT